MPGDLRYYSVHISTRASRQRGTSLCWSAPYPTPRDARQQCEALVRSGDASVAFAVRAEGADRAIISVHPASAAKVVRHYEDVLEAIEQPAKSGPSVPVVTDAHGQQWRAGPIAEPLP